MQKVIHRISKSIYYSDLHKTFETLKTFAIITHHLVDTQKYILYSHVIFRKNVAGQKAKMLTAWSSVVFTRIDKHNFEHHRDDFEMNFCDYIPIPITRLSITEITVYGPL